MRSIFPPLLHKDLFDPFSPLQRMPLFSSPFWLEFGEKGRKRRERNVDGREIPQGEKKKERSKFFFTPPQFTTDSGFFLRCFQRIRK